MNSDGLRRHLAARLAREDALRAFGAAGPSEPVLGLFATPLEAIDEILGLEVARAKYMWRGADALLRAVVSAYQTSDADVWPSMLLVAFHPAIVRLKRRAKSEDHDEEEIGAIVVDSFLAGARDLREIRTVRRIPMLLRQEMTRRVFHRLGIAQSDHTLVSSLVVEAQARGRIEPFAGGRPEAQRHAFDRLAMGEMVEGLAARFPGALDALLSQATSLRTLTAMLRPDLAPAEQKRLYQRLRQRFARARARGTEGDLPSWWEALTNHGESKRRRVS